MPKNRSVCENSRRAVSPVVRGRFLILGVFVLLAAFSVYGLSLTRTNSDITSYLSADTETARGLKVMNAEFPPLERADEAAEYSGQLIREMSGVLAISGAVILLVLLLTTASFADVIVCFIVFIVSALINMGTHFVLGTVSSITNTVSVILQLALSIDYAIIFAGRVSECEKEEADAEAAVSRAFREAAREIFSSSLTTVSGLLALTLMHFRFGADLGIALAKGVAVSMLTVFLLMPALMLFFAPLRRRTRHKPLIPRIRFLGRAAASKRPVLCIVFLVLFIPAAILSVNARFAFSASAVTPVIPDHSGSVPDVPEAMMAVLVPAGNIQAEKDTAQRLKALPQVTGVTAYVNVTEAAGIPVSPYDRFTPSQAAELLGADEAQVSALYRLFALRKGDIAAQFNIGKYAVSLEEAADYAFSEQGQELIGQYVPAEQQDQVLELSALWQEGKRQLKGENFMRMVVMAKTVPGSDEAEELLRGVHAILGDTYPGQETYAVGDVTSAHDLRSSFTLDSTQVNVLSALFVFVILTVTGLKARREKTPGPGSVLTALILVFVIQGSIFINFSLTNLFSQHPLFVTQMIGTAIQMGATVDYAIVLSGRYRDERRSLPPRAAAAAAAEKSFVTVMTSGSIMTIAGLTVAFRISDVYVGHIGLIVGRGALISSVLVLLVLPQLLVLCDRKDREADGAVGVLRGS